MSHPSPSICLHVPIRSNANNPISIGPVSPLRAVLISDCMAMWLGNQTVDPLGVQSFLSGAMYSGNRSSALGVDCDPDVILTALEGRGTRLPVASMSSSQPQEIGNRFEQEITPQPDLDLQSCSNLRDLVPIAWFTARGAQSPQSRMWKTTYSGTIQPCFLGHDKSWIR